MNDLISLQHGLLPDSIVNEYVEGMRIGKLINYCLRYGSIGLGVACLILAIIIFLYHSHKSHVR